MTRAAPRAVRPRTDGKDNVMGWFKSEEQKWAEAKTYAHELRDAAGHRHRKDRAEYTPDEIIKDQMREHRARGRKK